MHGNLLRFLLAAGVSAVVAAHPQSSGAAVFNVATPEELFTALSTAAGNGEDDVVNLAAGTYAGSQFQYYAGPGEPYSLSLIGAGAAETVFDAAGGDGLLYLYTHATDDSGIEIHVEGMTFRGVATSSWAALFVWTGFATLEIEGCAFIGNTSANYAGGLAVETTGGDVTVSASRFESNSGGTLGGGFFARNTDAASHVRLVENTFEGNSSSGSGGGAHIEGWGSAAIEGNRFLGNTSAGEGGGWYVYGQSTLSTGVFTGNVAAGNTAASHGGGARIRAFGTMVAGNVFAGNVSTAGEGGGAWFDTLAAAATFTANTFTGNQAHGVGGGLYVCYGAPAIYNNVFWTNTADSWGDDFGLWMNTFDTYIYHNDVTDFGSTGSYGEGGNIAADPLFADVSAADPALWDLRLLDNSPCIDAGLDGAPGLPAVDVGGLPRRMGAAPDMGAHESTRLFVEDFTDGGATGDDDWQKVSGVWKVNAAKRLYTSAAKVNLALVAGLPAATAGIVSADLKLARVPETTPNASIVFGYVDRTHYRYAKITPTGILLGQVGTIGAQAPVTRRAPRVFRTIPWYRIRVEYAADGATAVYVGAESTPALQFTFAGAPSGRAGLAAKKAKSFFDNFAAYDAAALP